MAVKLNDKAFALAIKLIEEGNFVNDDRGNWGEHQPQPQREKQIIDEYGMEEYERWYLGLDEDASGKERYKFPYGDFKEVHRCGVLSAEVHAAERNYFDVEVAAAHLHGMLEGAHARGKR